MHSALSLAARVREDYYEGIMKECVLQIILCMADGAEVSPVLIRFIHLHSKYHYWTPILFWDMFQLPLPSPFALNVAVASFAWLSRDG